MEGFVSVDYIMGALRYGHKWEQFGGKLSEDVTARVSLRCHSDRSFHLEVFKADPAGLTKATIEDVQGEAFERLLILRNLVAELNRGGTLPAAAFDDLWWKPKGGVV